MTADSLPAAAHADHLTEVLLKSGALGDGRVCNVGVVNSRATIMATITRLRLTYEGAAAGAPSALILKTSHPERVGDTNWDVGRQEVAFYTEVAARMSTPLVPRCFEAVWEAKTRTWHLLLEDLTDSHSIPKAWPLPPTFDECARIITARARFHAAWWDDPRLGVSIGTWLPADESHLKFFAQQFAAFVDRVGEHLSAGRRRVYERLIASGPRLNERYHSHRDLTIVHGDAHVWNVFLPRTSGSDDVRLFDWDSWRIDVGTDDLAYMMALHWYPEHRGRVEGALLDRYHDELVKIGVAGYSRDALEHDYRRSVLWRIATPVRQAAGNIPAWVWWNHLERIFMAVEDLECLDLLA